MARGNSMMEGTGPQASVQANFAGGVALDHSPFLVQGNEFSSSSHRLSLRSEMGRSPNIIRTRLGQRGTLHCIGGRRIVHKATAAPAGVQAAVEPRLLFYNHGPAFGSGATAVGATSDIIKVIAGVIYYTTPTAGDSWIPLTTYIDATTGAATPIPVVADSYPVAFNFVTRESSTVPTLARRVFYCDGVNPAIRIYKDGAGVMVADNRFHDASGVLAPPPIFNIAYKFGERVYVNDIVTGDTGRFCADITNHGPNNWPTENIFLTGFRFKGGLLRGIYALRGVMYALKENSLLQLDGAPDFTGITEICDWIGCTYPRTLDVWKGQHAYFLFQNKLWRHMGGRNIAPVSDHWGPIYFPQTMNVFRPQGYVNQAQDEYHLSGGNPEGTGASVPSLTSDRDFTFDIATKKITPRSTYDFFTCSRYIESASSSNAYELLPGTSLEGRVGLNTSSVYGGFAVVLTDNENFDYYPGDGKSFGNLRYSVRFVSGDYHMGKPGCEINLKALHIVHRTRNGFRATILGSQVVYNQIYIFDMTPSPDLILPATIAHLGALASDAATQTPNIADSLQIEGKSITKTRFELGRQPTNVLIPGLQLEQKGLCYRIDFMWDWIGYIYPGTIKTEDPDAIIAAAEIIAIIPEWEGYPVRQGGRNR